jgi:hypothetical protein
MNMDRWQSLIEMDMGFALDRLKDRGQLLPMVTLHDRSNGMHVCAIEVGSDEKVRHSMRIVRLMAVALDAQAISHVGEMWARFMAPYAGESQPEYEARVNAVRPRDAEDRREVVMATVHYRDDTGRPRELSQTRDILRGDDGRVTGLGPAPTDEVLDSEGPMTHLLTERRPNDQQMLYAKQLLKRLGFDMDKGH